MSRDAWQDADNADVKSFSFRCALSCLAAFLCLAIPKAHAEKPFHRAELIFPLESWHNHASCIVETPHGDLLVCWFHGSGERKADDVKIEGARLRRGATQWSARFTLADTPDYPDGNPCLFIDPQQKLWLFHTTILANTWESALLKCRISHDYERAGAPRWEASDVVHVKPGAEFQIGVSNALPRLEQAARDSNWNGRTQREVQDYLDAMRQRADDKLYSRLGWMTRAHPFVLDGRWLIVPLYHDGFSFSLMAITDDWGRTWHTSTPLIGGGNIQPSIVRRRDGSLFTLMRDNGPPPKRLIEAESFDRGETWLNVRDSGLPNPGSGAEIVGLRNSHWALIGNDLESGRHSLAVQISDDEGRSWKWKRHLELAARGDGSFSYPSLTQARDGSLHASYSFFIKQGGAESKSIKHAHFNEAWVCAGDSE
ncbi:MAG: exo-alpha-sialidase [Verrucomicrobia bacterium]|nr:exo-alpha-sialidase [Verrucomicrobiota bacterium]